MTKQLISNALLCLILFCLVLIPPVSAIVEYLEVPSSSDPFDRDRPENIAALKNHIAYISGSQEARMDGVIAYIDTISRSTEIDDLRQIQADYMAAAATIPVMNTSDQITALRDEMCTLSGHFAQETQSRLLRCNGNSGEMQKRIAISINAFDLSLAGMTDPIWLSQPGARITVFGRESYERNFTLRSLKEKGFEMSGAQRVSERIDAIRLELEAAVLGNKAETVLEINTKIKSLTQQYRNTVAASRAGTELSG